MSSEEWRPVVGYEGAYEVSSLGQVRSLDRDVVDKGGHTQRRRSKVLKFRPHRQGYVLVAIYGRPGGRRDVMVHVLVAEAFIGPRPPGLDVCHNNDVKADNRPENLRYDTRSENIRDTVRNGINPNSNKTHCVNGHEFTPENTRLRARRARKCRACARDYARRAYARAKGVAA